MIRIEPEITTYWEWVLEYCDRHPNEQFVATDIQYADGEPFISTLEQDTFLENRNTQITRRLGGIIAVSKIPGWATWTEDEALMWGETNIGTPLENARTSLPATLSLATARLAFITLLNILDQMWIMQKSMARMLVALRDKNWPDLPNE